MGTDTTTNRLADELSPYLQQHAHNPVDWYPWGDEALARAREEDRPILLSIGYSACHWCHVMEHESFDDPDIAALMNRLFVNVKVDREERPDLDQVYQVAHQLLTRRPGGWPLTVFLTPDLRPFFAGTYFPPTDRFGMPGFPAVLSRIAEIYADKREDVTQVGAELVDAIHRLTASQRDEADVPANVTTRAAKDLAVRFDAHNGGFGDQPKFPSTMALDVMLRAGVRDGDDASRERVLKTLDAMRAGGIYDQLGFGFHRYSTDARWRVPHFEKMLYDNALLLRLYADAYRATGDGRYEQTVREVVAYLEREMRSPAGGFYSTQDADSEGEEGTFFVWTPARLADVLGERDAAFAALRFGVTDAGNFEHNTTVLRIASTAEDIARVTGESVDATREKLETVRAQLFASREARERPFRDEKVIAAWNGLVIGALAEAGMALGEPRFTELAQEGLAFVRRVLWRDGTLARLHKDGVTKGEGFLEDYANVAGAALDVYEATMDAAALRFSEEVLHRAVAAFWDDEARGFYFAPARGDVVVRTKDAFDNAVPSGVSAMVHALLRLHGYTGEQDLFSKAEIVLRGMAREALTNPFAYPHLLGAMDRYVHGATEVVVVAAHDDPAGVALLDEARRRYLPSRRLVRLDPDAPENAAGSHGVGARRQAGGVATAYVCRGRACSSPVSSRAALADVLEAG